MRGLPTEGGSLDVAAWKQAEGLASNSIIDNQ